MAWQFDGSTDYWQNTSFSGPSASYKGTIGIWFRTGTVGASQALFAVQPSGAALTTFSIALNANSGFTIIGRNSANTIVLTAISANSLLSANTYYWLGISFDLDDDDMNNHSFDCYLDNTSLAITPSTSSYDTVDWSKPVWTIGATSDGSGGTSAMFDGRILEVVFWPGQYLDITDSDNRDMLIDHRYTPRLPVSYTLASRTFDADPTLYYAGAWLENLGTGPNLTKNGTPVWADGPDLDRDSAQGLRGDKWGKCDMCGWNFPMSQLKMEEDTGLLLCLVGPHDYPERKSRREEGWKEKGFFI